MKVVVLIRLGHIKHRHRRQGVLTGRLFLQALGSFVVIECDVNITNFQLGTKSEPSIVQ